MSTLDLARDASTPKSASTRHDAPSYRVLGGDCLTRLRKLPSESVHSIVTDPPYEIGVDGGRGWDSTGIAYSVELWREALRVLRPGGHLVVFGASRTTHRVICAIEDAGFDIRDVLAWHYASGMPKGLDVSKALDKDTGAARKVISRKVVSRGRSGFGATEDYRDRATVIEVSEPITDEGKRWDGWHTGLKPATEPIVLARKPSRRRVIDTIREHGTGALNIAATRIGARWLANAFFDASIADELGEHARYFFVPKPSRAERRAGLDGANIHPTVKPIELMRQLVRLVTPPGGLVLDPFCGSGTTGCAAMLEGMDFTGIEREEEYRRVARDRIRYWRSTQQPTRARKPAALAA